MAGLTFERTRNASLTLILSGGYLFSGLMFGPDLDIHSQQYKRWGVVRWIWLPYRRSMRHRAFLSHGLIVGTIVRLVYLLSFLAAGLAAVLIVSAIAYHATGEAETWVQFTQQYGRLGQDMIGRSLHHHTAEWLALLLGLELGAMSHSFSDWLGSRYKRLSPRKPSRASPKRSRRSSPATPPAVELPPVPQSSKVRSEE